MHPLTSNVSTLIGLTGIAVVLGLVAMIFVQYLGQLASTMLDNL